MKKLLSADRVLLGVGLFLLCGFLLSDFVLGRELSLGISQVAAAVAAAIMALFGFFGGISKVSRRFALPPLGWIYCVQSMIFAWAAMTWLPLAYVWGSYILFAMIVYLAAQRLRQGHRPKILLAFSMVFLTIGLVESFLWIRSQKVRIVESTERPELSDEDLWQRNLAKALPTYYHQGRYRSEKVAFDLFTKHQMYDVEYNIGPSGFRNTVVPHEVVGIPETVLFCGGSFTFGEGLNDAETLPSSFAMAAQCYALNFGMRGCGPHHALALFEDSRLGEWTHETTVSAIVYSCIPNHVGRVLGLAPFSRNDPAYALTEGGVRRVGWTGDYPLRDPTQEPSVYGFLDYYRCKSQMWRLAEHSYGPLYRRYAGKDITDRELELFLEIVKSAKETAQERLGTTRFIVVYWDHLKTQYPEKQLLSGLRERGIEVVLVSECIPDIPANPEKYCIKKDGHPNAMANALVAKKLVENLAKPNTSGDN